jgi:uncharacterized coiled-coil protein SlyX
MKGNTEDFEFYKQSAHVLDLLNNRVPEQIKAMSKSSNKLNKPLPQKEIDAFKAENARVKKLYLEYTGTKEKTASELKAEADNKYVQDIINQNYLLNDLTDKNRQAKAVADYKAKVNAKVKEKLAPTKILGTYSTSFAWQGLPLQNYPELKEKYSSVQEMRRNNTEGTYNHKKEIADQMSSIESIMADNKAKIAQLNSRVSSLSKKNNDLQAYITKLEERSAAQEQQIAELLTELENNKVVIKGLNKNVSELTASNQQKDEYIAQQMADANRAWFIVGSYSDLKEAGIVSKTGGFIGIGRRQGTLADMPTELFTEIDRTKVTTITINMKKAQVISKHPENSYELVADEEESGVTAYLRILNPTLFWKYTDYLVVSTK